jgi:hypothetical protein
MHMDALPRYLRLQLIPRTSASCDKHRPFDESISSTNFILEREAQRFREAIEHVGHADHVDDLCGFSIAKALSDAGNVG